MKLEKSREYTATEIMELEKKFWHECAEKYNKSFEAMLEPILNEMLAIARNSLKIPQDAPGCVLTPESHHPSSPTI